MPSRVVQLCQACSSVALITTSLSMARSAAATGKADSKTNNRLRKARKNDLPG